MEYILKNYNEVSKKEPLARNPLASLIRNELPSCFARVIENSQNYNIKGTPGNRDWAKIPWIGFLSKNVSPAFMHGYYVAYLFNEDMSAFYLTLMYGVGIFRNFNTEYLYKTSEEIREIIRISIPQIKIHSPMRLRSIYSNDYLASVYEKAAIYSIEYHIDDLPSENELMYDLLLLLGIYDVLHKNSLIDLLISDGPANKDFSEKILKYCMRALASFSNEFDSFYESNEYVKNLRGMPYNDFFDIQKILAESKYCQNLKITIDDSTTFYRPVLELFKDGKNHRNAEITDEIRKILPYGEKDSDKVPAWVSYPIKHFYDAGCLERMDRGVYCITEDGRKLLEMDIESLDRKVLKEYCPKFREKYSLRKEIEDNELSDSSQDEPETTGIAENNSPSEESAADNITDVKIKIHEIESKPNRYYNFRKHSNKYRKLAELLSDENVDKLENIYFLEEEQFDNIIENIIITHENVLKKLIEKNKIEFEKLNILDKMFMFSKSFVKTHYKTVGSSLGYYEYNEIYIEEREPTDYKKIRTIIHELSHFLLSEILEQVLSEILDTDKTDMLEAFILHTLTDVNDFNLIDEYCACTVEGRFIPLGHQDYTSFKNHLNEKENYSEDDLCKLGNTFAKYIISIMKSFLNENLINEIREKGLKIDIDNNDLGYETEEYSNWDDFRDTIAQILKYKSDYDKFDAETITDYSAKIRKNNN